ncbi:hypothetical protein V2G26_009919 [Clonostachys chloroleuca]
MFARASPSIYQSSKCFVTYGSMGHIDPKQLPHKSKPWSSLGSLDFVHKVDLLIPQEHYERLSEKLGQEITSTAYYKVSMTLEQILQGDFFTECIKRGNVLMLSEGKVTVDNMFTLINGNLTMYLEKEVYERAGLTGKPYGIKGDRGLKPRWIVTYDLRSPSMLHGKKGFDRLMYACKKVLNQQMKWLFSDVGQSIDSGLLEKLSATRIDVKPEVIQHIKTTQVALNMPASVLAEGDRTDLELVASDLYEWLSLVRLESHRIAANDDVDPYISRYKAPDGTDDEMEVCKITWQGFMSTSWIRQLLAETITHHSSQSWLSFSATELSTDVAGVHNELMLLRPPKAPEEYLMWEVKRTK